MRIRSPSWMVLKKVLISGSLLDIVQWWGFNVTVIIMNKWIFQDPRP
ncbi:hypothetical protein LINPERHAP1_LOCUS16566, partial [Linum perenne]